MARMRRDDQEPEVEGQAIRHGGLSNEEEVEGHGLKHGLGDQPEVAGQGFSWIGLDAYGNAFEIPSDRIISLSARRTARRSRGTVAGGLASPTIRTSRSTRGQMERPQRGSQRRLRDPIHRR